MGPGDPLQVVVTAREIYDAVVRLTGRVDVLITQQQEDRRDLQDHEQRIRGLERGRWPLPSAALLVALASAGAAVVSLITR